MTVYICKADNTIFNNDEEIERHLRKKHSRELRRVYRGLKPYTIAELWKENIVEQKERE